MWVSGNFLLVSCTTRHVHLPLPVQVRRFLNTYHADKYMVFNVSERQYDPACFDYRVLDAGFPDHFAPPLDLAWSVCSSMHSWLSAHADNVVAVHCKAGTVVVVSWRRGVCAGLTCSVCRVQAFVCVRGRLRLRVCVCARLLR